MPRRSRSLGAGSQVPLRGFASLLKNLDPGQKDRLQDAFSDAENLLSFHSLGVPERQQRRRISGLVRQIQVIATSSILGGFVQWERLDDPRIAFYEIQVGDDNAFSTAETTQILDTFFSIEGINTTKFIRVRGVRIDGETGLWSTTKSIIPDTISAPSVSSVEFYPVFIEGIDPETEKQFVFGGDLDPEGVQTFYTILSNTFYVNRLNGGISIWGYVSNRLKELQEAGVTPWDRVRFTVNGIHRLDQYYPHWTNAFSIDNANKTDFKDFYPGEPMTPPARGGYTAAFGPYAVAVPNTLAGTGPNDAKRVTAQDSTDGTFYWVDPMNASKPSRFDQAQLPAFDWPLPSHEAASFRINAQQKTHWIIFQNFNFDLPDDSIIVGLEAKIKRRQPHELQDNIAANFGIRRPDKVEGDNLVIEHLATSGNRRNATEANIIDFSGFGRALDLTVDIKGTDAISQARLAGDPSGNGTDGVVGTGVDGTSASRLYNGGSNFTIASWFFCPSPISDYNPGGASTHRIFSSTSPSGVSIDMFVDLFSPTNSILRYQGSFNSSAIGTLGFLYDPPSAAHAKVNQFHHYAITWNKSIDVGPDNDGRLELYIDGTLVALGIANATFNKNNTLDVRQSMAIGGIVGVTTGQSIFSQAQVGIWNTTLSSKEINELVNARGDTDYRFNFGDYHSANQLNHYFLVFPNQGDIIDEKVYLVDETGIRNDLDNKAIIDESWPQLGTFFYTTQRQCGFIPLALSDGIPHDNHLAIGYQQYGGELDLWGAPFLTVNQINNFYFGLAVQAKNNTLQSLGFKADAYIDHAKLTVFTIPEADREITVACSAASSNQFYLQRIVWSSLFNTIEIGALVKQIET